MRALFLAAILFVTSTPAVVAQPHVGVQAVPLANVKWTTGFWADRFETCRTVMIPTMTKIMAGTEHSLFLERFKIASGASEGANRGPPWNDGNCYKWLEAVAAVYAVTRDPALDQLMDATIETISQAQRADGYIHTPVLIKNRNGDTTAKPFQDRLNFEMYNFGHLFTTACVHHRATGATIHLNGKATIAAPTPGQYVELRRKWNTGDVVELNLPMRVRLLQANPLVEETRNHVAVQRGPIVYCLESPDLVKDTRVPSVRIPQSISLQPRFDAKLLGGVVVLEGDVEMNRDGA